MIKIKRSILFFALLLTSCASRMPALFATPTPVPPTETPLPPTNTPTPMGIVVNGEGITMEELNAELARYKASITTRGKSLQDTDVLKIVQDDFISQLLLTQGATEAGFKMDADALQKRLDELSTELGGKDKLADWQKTHGYTEEDFRQSLARATSAAWMRDQIASTVPLTAEQVHVRQILLYNKDVAQAYYDRLQQGEDFDELADQVDPVTRGDIGWFPRGYLAEKAIEDAAFSLGAGATSEIIHSDAGFHIIKVLEIQPERELSPDALATLQVNAVNLWLVERRQKSNIILTP